MSDDLMAKQPRTSTNQSTGMGFANFKAVNADQLNFDGATSVISSAQKFILPIPALGAAAEPLVHPEGSSNAGKAIVDYKGAAIGESGLVFFNGKDQSWQAVPGDGAGVIIINEVSRDQAIALLDKVKSFVDDAAKLSIGQIKEVLSFAKGLGLKDMYNSSVSFIDSKMTPADPSLVPSKGYGFMKRDDRDLCQAIRIDGAFSFDGPAATPQIFENGGVIVKQGNSVRGVQSEVFMRTYRHSDGSAIQDISELVAV